LLRRTNHRSSLRSEATGGERGEPQKSLMVGVCLAFDSDVNMKFCGARISGCDGVSVTRGLLGSHLLRLIEASNRHNSGIRPLLHKRGIPRSRLDPWDWRRRLAGDGRRDDYEPCYDRRPLPKLHTATCTRRALGRQPRGPCWQHSSLPERDSRCRKS
jgi:hypothetical protein